MTSRFFENPITRSLALHFFLLMLLFCYVAQLRTPDFASQPIEVSVIEPKKDLKSEAEQRSKTVVQSSAGEEAKIAKKDSYLSDKTRTVKEERSARNAGEVAPLPAIHINPVQRKEAVKEREKTVKLNDLGLKVVPKEPPKYEDQRNWADQQSGETVQGGQYIKGMKEGEVSALNTKEFVFYSYFERVRRQLDQAWQPILRQNIHKIMKTGRRLASNEDYVTRTLVTLNPKGEILKIQILEESGTHDVDQAAVDALNKAGPYPNPPKGLIDRNGTVELRWDFVLKT